MDELNRILQKAETLMLRFGLKSVTMDDLSRELGISKKTLYQYFSNKEQLVAELVKRRIEQTNRAEEEIRTQAANAVEEVVLLAKYHNTVLAVTSPVVLYDLRKYYVRCWHQFETHQVHDKIQSIEANLHRGTAEGLYRDDLDVPVVARLFIIQVLSIWDSEHFPPTEFDMSKVHVAFVKHHIHAIANQHGLEVFHRLMQSYSL